MCIRVARVAATPWGGRISTRGTLRYHFFDGEDYEWLTRAVLDACPRARDRCVSILEGGYAVGATSA